MAKKKVKNEKKTPDAVMKTMGYQTNIIKENPRKVGLYAAILLFIILVIIGYNIYVKRVNEEVQQRLFAGIEALSNYSLSGEEKDLKRAEAEFGYVVKKGEKNIKGIAKLYLGRISLIKGKREEAKRLFKEIENGPYDPLIKSLSANAIKSL
jgi:hypothetical protein